MNGELRSLPGRPEAREPDPPSRRTVRPAAARPVPPRRCEIQLLNPCRYPEAGARRLRPWLAPVVAAVAPQAESFAVRFISDREMRRLNAAFRRRDEPTDILSFPGDDTSLFPRSPRHLGDVAISVPAARRQARHLGHSVEVELRILLLHGILHCLGHDHETDGGVMERLEKRLRRRFVTDG